MKQGFLKYYSEWRCSRVSVRDRQGGRKSGVVVKRVSTVTYYTNDMAHKLYFSLVQTPRIEHLLMMLLVSFWFMASTYGHTQELLFVFLQVIHPHSISYKSSKVNKEEL